MMVAFGYHGAKFHGSQIQPDVRTVQGELKQAIERLGWWTESCLEMSSRTDSGVSVRMNLATISLPTDIANVIDESSLVSALNDHLPEDLVVWKACRVPEGTRSRIAKNRLYIYRLEMIPGWPYDVEYERFNNACNLFVGQHDFTNFCRLDSGRSPIRKIESCQPWLDNSGRIVGFSVVAESFLWNQIRRMASSLHKFAKNDRVFDLVSLKGARHGFDNPFLFFGFEFTKLPSLDNHSDECTLTINNYGNIQTVSGEIIYGPEESADIIDRCSSKGVMVKYNHEATLKSQEHVLNFLSKTLNNMQ